MCSHALPFKMIIFGPKNAHAAIVCRLLIRYYCNDLTKKGVPKKYLTKKGVPKSNFTKKGVPKNDLTNKGAPKNNLTKKGVLKNDLTKKGVQERFDQ